MILVSAIIGVAGALVAIYSGLRILQLQRSLNLNSRQLADLPKQFMTDLTARFGREIAVVVRRIQESDSPAYIRKELRQEFEVAIGESVSDDLFTKVVDMLAKLPRLDSTEDVRPDRHRFRLTLFPGTWLRTVAKFFCTKKTCEQVFKPLLDDIQLEYLEAVATKRKWQARWIRLSGYFVFWKTAVACCLSKLIRDTTSMIN